MRTLMMAAVTAAGFALSACSTIVEGNSQDLSIATSPSGAACEVKREGMVIAKVDKTPGIVRIQKTKHDVVIECAMPEYHTVTYFNKSDAAGATFGNIILGGGVGWAIDSATGSDNKYTSPVYLTMTPASEAAPAPIYSNPPKKADEKAEADTLAIH